jgi:hypothetical protein
MPSPARLVITGMRAVAHDPDAVQPTGVLRSSGASLKLPAVFPREMPALLAAALKAPFANDHEGHDFQALDEFASSEEGADWWTAWTGNEDAGVPPFRFFGQDGSGGQAGIWLRDPEAAIETQPVVFLGSEGELAVIARDLHDYLWLLANGVGPLEAVDDLDRTPEPIPELIALAHGEPRSVEAILSETGPILAALEELVEETVNGPFFEDGEPLD